MAALLALVSLAVGVAGAGEAPPGQVYFPRFCRIEGGECTFAADGWRAVALPPSGLRLGGSGQGGQAQTWELRAEDFARLIPCVEDVCSLPENRGCYARCLASPPVPKLIDLESRRLYFTVRDYGRWITFFALGLEGGKVTRLFRDAASEDFAGTTLSPDRRYVAYLIAQRASQCESFAQLRVFDLREGRQVAFPGEEDPWKRVRSMRTVRSDSDPRWVSSDEIELRRTEWTLESCESGRHPDDDTVSVVRLRVKD